MPMSMNELERALRGLRLSGMTATLPARALQVASHEMDFVEAFSWMIQDELDRRRSRLLDRRFANSGLPERKTLQDIDWSYNPKLPKRALLELATFAFIDARENVLLIGRPGTGKSHAAKALALSAVQRGYKVAYVDAARKEKRTVHAVGDGTFIIDGRRIDRRKMMASRIPFGV